MYDIQLVRTFSIINYLCCVENYIYAVWENADGLWKQFK